MKHLFFSAALALLFPLAVSAVVKVDVDGRGAGIAVKEMETSGGLRPDHPKWANPPEQYLIFTMSRRAPAEWTAFRCSFTPEADGEVIVSRRGLSSKPDINHWVLYRNFKVTGAEVKFHRAAKANTISNDPLVERSGHHHGIVDILAVKAGRPVTLEFEAKSGGTEKTSAHPKEDYLLPPGQSSALKTIEVVADGTAAGISLKNTGTLRGFQPDPDIRAPKDHSGSLRFSTPRSAGASWAKYEFSFTPDIGGDVALRRQDRMTDSSILDWIEFRNFKVTGGTLRRHLTAPVNAVAVPGVERGVSRAPLYDIVIVEPGKTVKVEFEVRSADSEPYKKYPAKSYRLNPPDYKVAWQDKTIQLLGPDDKGASFSIYGKNKELVDLPQAVFQNPKGKLPLMEAVSVPVEIAEEDGIPRRAEVRFGFPLPEKMFHEVGSLKVVSPSGKEVPAQFSVLGRWGDQSVKWALVEFTAPLNAGEKAVYQVQAGKDVKPVPVESPLSVTEKEGVYSVSTGCLSCRIDRNSPALAESITVNGKDFGSLLPVAVSETGVPARAHSVRAAIEEQGPVSVTFRIDGDFKGDRRPGGYTARLRFFSGSPVVKVTFTYRADDLSNELNDLNSLHLKLTCGKGKFSSGTARIFQPDDMAYWIDSTKKEGFMPDTGVFLSSSGKIAFGLADAGKRYPKAFSAAPDGLDIQLLPEQPSKEFGSTLPGYLRFPYCSGKYRIMAGMNFTEELIFDFGGSPVSTQEIVPVVDRAWHAKAGAVPGVSADGLSASFDAKAIEAFREHLKRKKLQREYGFLNWGDWFGERDGNWGNNEYDFAYGLFTLFVRTGNRDVYRHAMVAARHQSDVDIIHATPYPEFLGGNHMHCVGHTGMRYEPNGKPTPWFGGQQILANAANGHTWCGGMFTAWVLAGKADIADSALLLGEHLIRDSVKPYRNQGNPRSHGWMLEALMQAYDASGDPKYLKAADTVADSLCKVQNFEHGGAWAYKLPPTYARGHKDAVGNSCFQMGVVSQALRHYANRANRPETSRNLSAVSSWLRKTWDPAAIGWPYVASWDGTPLWPCFSHLNMLILPGAYADGTAEGLQIVQTALRFSMLKGQPMDGIGKDLAINLVFAPVIFEMLKKAPTPYVFSPELFLKERAQSQRRLKLRGPERKELEIVLRNSAAELRLERNFYNSRPNGKNTFSYVLTGPDGTNVSKFEGSVRKEKLQEKIPLRGKAGDVFKLIINDDMTSYWEVDGGKGAAVRVKLVSGSQFANGFPLFFTLRVPAGTKLFTIRLNAAHPGCYGMILADASGKIVGKAAQWSGNTRLPWLEKPVGPPNQINLKMNGGDFKEEQMFSLLTWSQGDIVLELDGIPPYLEYTSKTDFTEK